LTKLSRKLDGRLFRNVMHVLIIDIMLW